MKKIILLVLVMLIVIPLASATDWDNVLDYENKDLTVKITNWFGLFGWLGLDDRIGTVELKSHLSVNEVKLVGAGNQVVMWYDFDFVELYPNGLGEVEFTDVITGKDIDRDYSFVYWGENERNIYGEGKCSFTLNGTQICETIVVGKETYEAWLPYNSRDIPKGKVRIGLRTYVEVDDKVDGKWIIAGKKVKKHSVWTASLNVGLKYYYAFEEVAGDFTDQVSGNDLVENGVVGRVTGKIGKGVEFNDNDANYLRSGGNVGITGAEPRTTCWWSEQDGIANRETFVSWGVALAYRSWWVWFYENAPYYLVVTLHTEDLKSNVQTTTNMDFHCVVFNGTTVNWYRNGSSIVNMTALAIVNTTDSVLSVGISYATDNPMDGIIDELGIWNRTLTDAEVVQLYNGGAGITYTNVFGPIVDVVFPLNITYNETVNQLNYTATTFGVEDRCWNSVDGGITNSTDVPFGTNFTITSVAGTNTWIVYCNNTASVVGLDSVTFLVNKSVITDLVIPVNDSNFTITLTTFSIESTPVNTNLANVTLNVFFDNGTLLLSNFSTLAGSSAIQTNFSGIIENDGNYIWNAETCGDDVDCDLSENRTFEIHTTPSTIIINFPKGNINSFATGSNLTLNWTIIEPAQNLSAHIINCSYVYNGVETFLQNVSVCVETNETSFLYVNGVNNLIFKVVEEFNITSTNSTSWTFSFLETGVSFNENVSETASETFDINLTTDISILSISAKLNYNGTNHSSEASCVIGNCTISNTIDIPLVSVGESILYNFSWIIDIFNGTDSSSITTSIRQQNVSRIHIEECNATFPVETLNFTVYDEQTLERILPFTFDGTFEFWLDGGAVTRNNSLTNVSDSYSVCLQPNETFIVDAIIDYDEHSNFTNYTNRFYYFDEELLTNTTQDIFMYLLKSTTSTSFILKVQDDSLLPVTDAIIEIHRFYPGTGEFRIVQIARTDDNGKSIGFFETETVDYKFIIKKNGETLLETGQQKVIPETSPFTLTFNIGEPLGEPWESQEELEDFNSSLTWDDSTGIVTYIYIDSSDNFTLARLIVVKESLVNLTADTTICNENSTLTSATLTCTVGSDNGFYLVSTFITRNSVETLDRQFTFQIETLSGVVGLLGLFFGWFLILIASFMFKFNEIAGIWAITVTVFLVNLMGLISFGGVFVTATIAVAIILTWVMEK